MYLHNVRNFICYLTENTLFFFYKYHNFSAAQISYVDIIRIFKVKVRDSCINQRVLMVKLYFEGLDGMQCTVMPQAVSDVPITDNAWICDPRPVSVRSVVGKVALVQVFLKVLRFSPISNISQ